MRQSLSLAPGVVACALVLFGLLLVREVRAVDANCGVTRPWVMLAISGTNSVFAAQIISDLRAGLAPSRIDACVPSKLQRKEPLASVKISAAGVQVYSIDVSDSVTQKRIGRDVDLAHVPEDGRAFALAVAAEELLRASWAELALARNKREPPSAKPAPAKGFAQAERSPGVALPAASRAALGLGLGFEHYGGGQVHFGVDLLWRYPLLSKLFVGVEVGGRRALSVDAPDGSIAASAAGAELSLRPSLVDAGVLLLEGILAARTSHVWFTPEPAGEAVSTRRASYTLFGRGGLALVIGRPGFIRSITSLGAGVPIRSFSASDAGQVITGVSGVEYFVRSAVALEL